MEKGRELLAAALRVKNPKQADDLLVRALCVSPDLGEAYAGRAKLAVQRGDLRGATYNLRVAFARGARTPEIRVLLAVCLNAVGEEEMARQIKGDLPIPRALMAFAEAAAKHAHLVEEMLSHPLPKPGVPATVPGEPTCEERRAARGRDRSPVPANPAVPPPVEDLFADARTPRAPIPTSSRPSAPPPVELPPRSRTPLPSGAASGSAVPPPAEDLFGPTGGLLGEPTKLPFEREGPPPSSAPPRRPMGSRPASAPPGRVVSLSPASAPPASRPPASAPPGRVVSLAPASAPPRRAARSSAPIPDLSLNAPTPTMRRSISMAPIELPSEPPQSVGDEEFETNRPQPIGLRRPSGPPPDRGKVETIRRKSSRPDWLETLDPHTDRQAVETESWVEDNQAHIKGVGRGRFNGAPLALSAQPAMEASQAISPVTGRPITAHDCPTPQLDLAPIDELEAAHYIDQGTIPHKSIRVAVRIPGPVVAVPGKNPRQLCKRLALAITHDEIVLKDTDNPKVPLIRLSRRSITLFEVVNDGGQLTFYMLDGRQMHLDLRPLKARAFKLSLKVVREITRIMEA